MCIPHNLFSLSLYLCNYKIPVIWYVSDFPRNNCVRGADKISAECLVHRLVGLYSNLEIKSHIYVHRKKKKSVEITHILKCYESHLETIVRGGKLWRMCVTIFILGPIFLGLCCIQMSILSSEIRCLY